MKTTEVAVAGAGIIGISVALEMADAGRKVVVIERGRAMNEASWAAAGMLAGHDPENPPALRPLSDLSLRLYPEYLRRISELSGREIPIRTKTTLHATRRAEKFTGEASLFGAFSAIASGRRIIPTQAQGYVEGLVTDDRELLLLEEESIDPRDLCGALPLAAKAAGIAIIEETAVRKINATESGVEITTSAGLLHAAEFIDCRGAWGGEPLFDSPDKNYCVKPCKGQMVTVEIADPTLLRIVVRTPEVYLVPRGDGRIVIGATVEDAGFDKTVDNDAVSRLLADAKALWPRLGKASVVASWAGLRPATHDYLPLIGAVRVPHCWLAAGHFRNGILLAPATAALMRQLIDIEKTGGQKIEAAFQAFSPLRFA